MSRFRYTYTPRRRPPRGRPSLSPFLIAPILLTTILAGWWLARNSGSGEPLEETLVLGASCAPGAQCGTSPTPTARPPAGFGDGSRPTPSGEDPPAITGVSAIVLEDPCGATLFQQNPHLRRPPASLTKIMTAIVAAERSQPDEMVRIKVNGPELSAATDSTVMGIEPGMTLSMRDLLYGLLLASGNDAALQIAEHVAGSVPSFVRLMNEKAQALGLTDTHFSNPHGLDDANLYTSAHDIAVLGRELLNNPELAEIVRTRTYQPAWDKPALQNLNLLLGFYQGAIGVKTGYTDLAGQTIVGAAERDGRRIIVAVMGSKTDIYADASSLLEWAFTATRPACGPASPTS